MMQEFVLSLGKNARRSIAIKATAAEAAELTCAEGKATVPGARRVLDRSDTTVLAAAVSSADIDGDGIVTRHEFSAWMAKQAAAAAEASGAAAAAVTAPTARQLGLFGLNVAIPMIGFGFMDNFIMILAGDAIDASIGAEKRRARRACVLSSASVCPEPVLVKSSFFPWNPHENSANICRYQVWHLNDGQRCLGVHLIFQLVHPSHVQATSGSHPAEFKPDTDSLSLCVCVRVCAG